MSHARDTYEKKHGRRKAGTYGPPRKGNKQISSRAIRVNGKVELQKKVQEYA